MLEFEGKLIVKKETQIISEKFSKREFVIQDDGQYPQTVQFQLTQDKCDLLDSYKVGDTVKVLFNLRGRLWTNKDGVDMYFNSLDAWKIESVKDQYNQAVDDAQGIPTAPIDTDINDGDLPF